MAHTRNKEVSIGCLNYTVNSFFVITSTITLLISLTLKYEFSIFGNYLNYYSGTPTLSLFIISVVTLLDAIFGFVSLKKKTRCGLIAFAICTMYLFVSVVALVGVTLIFSVEAEQKLYSNLKEDMRINQTANNNDTIDAIQVHLNCCGYKNLTEWLNGSSNSLPRSCCTFSDICDAKNSPDVHTIGCEDALTDFLTSRKWFVVGILAILGFVEIYSIISSLIVYQRLAKITTTPSPVNNIPRVNPLPPVDNAVPYVRRPTQLPVVLTYRSAHESFLKQPPQNRFDRRLMLPNVKYTIPHAK